MNDAYTLLGLNKDVLTDFHLLAKLVDDYQTEKVINTNLRQLKSIEERMLADGGINVSKHSIDEVLYKVVKAALKKEIVMEDWTMRELRIVSYYMMKLQDEELAFDYALKLLDKGWKNIYFNGLIFYLMNSWCLIKPHQRVSTSQLIIEKLQEYEDNNQRYNTLKNHANMFEEAGPERLAYLLISKKIDVREAPKLLGFKKSAISQSYFSDVIIKYNARKTLDENTLEELFHIHNNQRTKQLVFADLVKKADDEADPIKQTQLSNFINRTLGDVTLTKTWAPFIGATADEAQKLKEAMQKVNLWFTRRIIETFFEICVQDRERKRFWLDYVQYVRGFRIAGSDITKHILQNDSRIGSLFKRHFIETNSRISQTSALILNIKDYILIEFSDTGCLYAYKQDNRKIKFLKQGARTISSISELKEPSMDMLVKSDYWYNNYNDEGRLYHKGNWKDRLKSWLEFNVITSSSYGTPFFEALYDDIFTAQPLPQQEQIRKPQPEVKVAVNKSERTSDSKQLNFYGETGKASSQQRYHSPSNALSQTRQEPKQEYKSEPKPALQLTTNPITEAKYKGNINYSRTSKYFFFDICRVVANDDGFYVHIYKTKRFVKVRGIYGNNLPFGNIWIKGSNSDGWNTIVYALASKQEFIVGYIKQAGGGLLFKQDLALSSYMTINIK